MWNMRVKVIACEEGSSRESEGERDSGDEEESHSEGEEESRSKDEEESCSKDEKENHSEDEEESCSKDEEESHITDDEESHGIDEKESHSRYLKGSYSGDKTGSCCGQSHNKAKEGTWNDSQKEIGNSGATLEEVNRRQGGSALGTSQKHLKTRIEADKQYRLNAYCMKLKYCKAKQKKVVTFKRGDIVSIRIPRIDCTSTDFHCLPCVVVERQGSKYHLYRLRYVTCTS